MKTSSTRKRSRILIPLLLLVAIVLPSLTYGQITGPFNYANPPLLRTTSASTNTGETNILPYNAGGSASVNVWSAAQPIPFNFYFFGQLVTHYCVSKNYLLTFDTTVANTFVNQALNINTALPNANLPANTIAYFWGDTAATLGSNDVVYSSVLGTAPNRQLWVRNFSYYTGDHSYSYDGVVLEESTNKIYFIDWYHSSTGGTKTLGLQKDFTTYIQHPSSPNLALVVGSQSGVTDMKYYTVETPSGQFDAAVTKITKPNNDTVCNLSAAEQVSIEVRNFGSNTISNFLVYYKINNLAPVAGLVTTPLTTFGSTSFTFPVPANLSATGSYNITAWTALAGDVNPANDTSKTTVVNYAGKVTVQVLTDVYPEETSWKLYDGNTNAVIAQDGPYPSAAENTLFTKNICIDPSACLVFKIFDSFGDGIFSPGYFKVLYNGALIDSGGSFAFNDVVTDITGACIDVNDAALTEIYTFGRIPRLFMNKLRIGAYIRNNGNINLNNLPVVLSNAGVNSIADTQLISINSGDSLMVTFDTAAFINNGTDNITVAIPADANNGNNSLGKTMQVTDNQIAYADNSPMTRSIGLGTSKGYLLCKYSSTESKFVPDVSVFIAGSALGKEVYAVVMNSAGTIIANSAPRVITPADTATLVNFPMTTYPLIAGNDFFVGLALPDTGFYPVGSQAEYPTRTGAYYAVLNLAAGVSPSDIGNQNLGRLAIGCSLGKSIKTRLNAGSLCKDNNGLVGLEVTNFASIASFSFSIEFDTSRLTFTGLQNVNVNLPNVLANQTGKQVRISWVAQGTPILPVTLPDGKIFDLGFTAKAAGNAIFKWDVTTQGANEFSSIGGIGIASSYTNDTLLVQNCGSFAGKLEYDNTEVNPPIANKPLANVGIQLMPGENTVTTNSTGNFGFGDIPVGNYAMLYTNTKPWGGGNALDGLVILKHFVGIAPLSGVKLKSADCNGDNAINSQDALLVSNRFVGIISKFERIVVVAPGDTQRTTLSDWVYLHDNINLTGDTALNITSVCRGDANGTYVSFSKESPQVELVKAGTMPVGDGITEIPVRVTKAMSLGAASLVIDAPLGVEILDASFGTANGTYIYNVIEGRQLRISWYSLLASEFSAGDVLLTIRTRLNDVINPDFAITENSLLANADAEVYPGAKLSIPTIFQATDAAGFSLSNYPNPFSNSTTISFELPEAGQVNLKVYDMLGKEVAVLVNEYLSSGSHQLTFKKGKLEPGVYHYSMKAGDHYCSKYMVIGR